MYDGVGSAVRQFCKTKESESGTSLEVDQDKPEVKVIDVEEDKLNYDKFDDCQKDDDSEFEEKAALDMIRGAYHSDVYDVSDIRKGTDEGQVSSKEIAPRINSKIPRGSSVAKKKRDRKERGIVADGTVGRTRDTFF